MIRERLQEEFLSTLNMFQAAQKRAAEKEKQQINKTKEKAFGEPFLGNFGFVDSLGTIVL